VIETLQHGTIIHDGNLHPEHGEADSPSSAGTGDYFGVGGEAIYQAPISNSA